MGFLVRLHVVLHCDVDVLKNMTWRDRDHAVRFHQIVAALTVLLAAERIDETKRCAQHAGADGEARPVSLPVGSLVVFSRNFLFILRHVVLL